MKEPPLFPFLHGGAILSEIDSLQGSIGVMGGPVNQSV